MEPTFYEEFYSIEEKHWFFRARREIIFGCFERFCAQENNLRILDAGMGTGINYRYLQRYGQVTGIDPSKDAIHFSKLRGCRDVKECSVVSTPFASSSFDAVFILDVLEHLDDDRRALKEVNRILKTEGMAIIVVPAFQFLWGSQDLYAHHRRRYTLTQIKRMTEGAGFEARYISYFNFFFFPLAVFIRFWQRLFRVPPTSDVRFSHPLLDYVFYQIMRSESYLLSKKIGLPWGVSILCLAQKTSKV